MDAKVVFNIAWSVSKHKTAFLSMDIYNLQLELVSRFDFIFLLLTAN